MGMHTLRAYLIAALAGLLLQGCLGQRSGVYRKLKPEAYQDKLAGATAPLLVDVRTPGEYRKGHIPTAVNISFLSGDFKEQAAELDTLRPIFIYCETAHRSPMAAKRLHKLGFDRIYDLKGGCFKWRKQDLPLEKSPTDK